LGSICPKGLTDVKVYIERYKSIEGNYIIMIPKWIYECMVENRARCGMTHDEHGRPIEERRRRIAPRSDLASPGYADYPVGQSSENVSEIYQPEEGLRSYLGVEVDKRESKLTLLGS
jgi:hypothetical protein